MLGRWGSRRAGTCVPGNCSPAVPRASSGLGPSSPLSPALPVYSRPPPTLSYEMSIGAGPGSQSVSVRRTQSFALLGLKLWPGEAVRVAGERQALSLGRQLSRSIPRRVPCAEPVGGAGCGDSPGGPPAGPPPAAARAQAAWAQVSPAPKGRRAREAPVPHFSRVWTFSYASRGQSHGGGGRRSRFTAERAERGAEQALGRGRTGIRARVGVRGGAALCIVGCPAAPLASAHTPAVTAQNARRHAQCPPGGAIE